MYGMEDFGEKNKIKKDDLNNNFFTNGCMLEPLTMQREQWEWTTATPSAGQTLKHELWLQKRGKLQTQAV